MPIRGLVDNRKRAHTHISFLFADNFPFKYHKRDTKSRIMYLDQLDKNTTRHHQMPTRSGEPEQSQNNNEKKKSMAQANVKHNINTNLQSCNNFLQFFTSLHSCVLFHFVYLANSLILMRAVFFSLLFCQDLPIYWRQDLDFTSLILFKNNAPNLSSSVDSVFFCRLSIHFILSHHNHHKLTHVCRLHH